MPGFDQTTPSTVGRTLGGRYRLVAPIARGGMAEVWEGHDEVLSRPVAVKVLQAHLASDGVFLERFRREAVTAARLAHPGIVATFDTGLDSGTAYIVMELVRGRNLRQYLHDEGRLEAWQAVAVARQITDALAYAHQAGLVHRDIKPANVLLVEDELSATRVKVTDFGIAKAGAGLGDDLTRTGIVLGTPKYLSPEQIRGADPDGRADLYSLGVIIYEMLVGEPPYVGETDMSTALAHLNERVPKVSARLRSVPPGLDRLVGELLAKDAARRIPSAAVLRNRIDALGPMAPPTGAGANRGRSSRWRSPPGGVAPPARQTPHSPTTAVPPVPAGPWPNGSGAMAGAGADGTAVMGTGFTSAPSPPGSPSPGSRPPGSVAQPGSRPPGSVAPPGSVGPPAPGPYRAPSDYPDRPGVSPFNGAGGPARSGPSTDELLAPVAPARRFRRSERTAGLVVLALVLIGGLVAGVLLATQSHRNRPPAATSPPPAHTASVLHISSVNVFMFSSANTPDDPAGTLFTFDGNPTTFWHTDQYRSSTFSNLYPGIGLVIRLSAGATLHTLSVTSPTSGWAARTYVSNTALATGQPLSAWGSPTDTKSSIPGDTTFTLAGRHGQYVLLWLTNLGPAPFQVRIAELGIS